MVRYCQSESRLASMRQEGIGHHPFVCFIDLRSVHYYACVFTLAIHTYHSRHSTAESQSQCGADATERNMAKSESVRLRVEVAPCCMI